MAKRPTINTLTNTAAPSYLTESNQNFTNIKNQFDNTLSLDGSTPNAMNADIDLNGNDLINANSVSTVSLRIGGENVVASSATALAVKKEFETVVLLLADTGSYTNYAEGDYLRVVSGGFTYQVAASGATDQDLTTAGGVKLYALPCAEFLCPRQFGAVGNGTADDTEPLYLTFRASHSRSLPVDLGGLTYLVKKTNYIPMFDGLHVLGRRAKIIIDIAANVTDTTGSFLRYSNWLFYKSTSTAITRGIKFEDVIIEDNRGYTNAFGGVECASRLSNTAEIEIASCEYIGFGTLAADADTKAGALWQGAGYALHIHDCISIDTGYAVFAPNSKSTRIYRNKFSFCGVSRDFAKWSNVAALTTWNSINDDITDNIIYVTGGTSLFIGVDSNTRKELLRCVGNTVIGAGLSAISSDIRDYATAGAEIVQSIVSGNVIQGFLCCVAGTSHDGIKVGTDTALGVIRSIVLGGNTVDYLAPWETFDTGTNAVTGSYNTNKSLGGDTNTTRGINATAVSGGTIERLDGVGDLVRNAQMIACGIDRVAAVNYDFASDNCGWAKQVGGAPLASRVLSGLDISNTTAAVIRYRAQDHAVGVTASNALASLIRAIDNADIVLSAVFRGATSQQYMLRIANTLSNLKVTVLEMDPGPMFLLDGGHVRFVDTSAGATTLSTEIRWVAKAAPEIIAGSRTIPINSELLVKTDTAARTETLPPAKAMTGRVVRFVNKGSAGNITVTPNGSETIDGVAASVTVLPTAAISLLSTGTAWLSV